MRGDLHFRYVFLLFGLHVFPQFANILTPFVSPLVLVWILEKHKCGVLLCSQKLNISR